MPENDNPFTNQSSYFGEYFQEGGLAERENIASAKRIEENMKKQREYAKKRLFDSEGLDGDDKKE